MTIKTVLVALLNLSACCAYDFFPPKTAHFPERECHRLSICLDNIGPSLTILRDTIDRAIEQDGRGGEYFAAGEKIACMGDVIEVSLPVAVCAFLQFGHVCANLTLIRERLQDIIYFGCDHCGSAAIGDKGAQLLRDGALTVRFLKHKDVIQCMNGTIPREGRMCVHEGGSSCWVKPT